MKKEGFKLREEGKEVELSKLIERRICDGRIINISSYYFDKNNNNSKYEYWYEDEFGNDWNCKTEMIIESRDNTIEGLLD